SKRRTRNTRRDRCIISVGENLAFAHCPSDTLAGVLLAHLPQVIADRRCLMIEGRAMLRGSGVLYRSALFPLSEGGIVIDHVLGAANHRLLREKEELIAKIADQFLLLGVDRDHWLVGGQSSGHLGVDMGELRIPVGMAVTLLGLAVSLQAVTRRIEQFTPECGSPGGPAAAALRPIVARFCRSTATAIPDPPGSSVRPAPRDR